MENDQVLNLELTVQEVNIVLRSLGKHPFEEISQLINKIKVQGEAQLVVATPEEVGETVAE